MSFEKHEFIFLCRTLRIVQKVKNIGEYGLKYVHISKMF